MVYGPPPPAYPYYPYTYPGYVPGTALTWGAGIALGAAAWGAWGGHWGNCDWNGGNVKINNNYNYNKNNNFNRNVNRQGQGNWQHNPQHRGNAPYGDRNTANKFGGRGPGGAVAPEDPVERVVLEDLAARVALVVPGDPVAARVASVGLEDPVARGGIGGAGRPVAPAGELALEIDRVVVQAQVIDPAAELVLAIDPVVVQAQEIVRRWWRSWNTSRWRRCRCETIDAPGWRYR